MTKPTIPAAWAALTAEACKHSVGGVLSPGELNNLHRACARDCGVTVDQVRTWLEVQRG